MAGARTISGSKYRASNPRIYCHRPNLAATRSAQPETQRLDGDQNLPHLGTQEQHFLPKSQGAEFGWTSLLVDEDHGGGSISGNRLLDPLIVAYHFGRCAAPGPLLVTNLVALALARWGAPEQRRGPLAELMSGTASATWAGPGSQPGARPAGDGVALDGILACVESASDCAYLLAFALGFAARAPAPRSARRAVRTRASCRARRGPSRS